MKIKGLLLGMFACAALVACTDNDIVENDGITPDEGVKGTAFVTLSIDASTNSSRATEGDTDSDADDNGHHNAGTVAENAVNEVLVVLNGPGDGANTVLNVSQFTKSVDGKEYTLNDDAVFRMTKLGNYKVLVVLNPVERLKTAVAGKGYAEAYTTVLNYEYNTTETTNDAAMNAYTNKGFMMSNRDEEEVSVTASNNSPANAAEAQVEVERAISKITFRPKPAVGNLGINTYQVTVNEKQFDPVTEKGWEEKKVEEINKWFYTTFNSANNGAVWITVSGGAAINSDGKLTKNEITGVYTKTAESHTGTVGNIQVPASIFTAISEANWPATIVLDRKGESAPQPAAQTYYVHLQKYALTNLSKSIYGVRHVTKTYATSDTKALGKLTTAGYPYLVDPKSTEKNVASLFDEYGEWADAAAKAKPATWFYNTLENVTAEANTMTDNTENFTFFKDLPTGITAEDGDQTTTDNAHDGAQVGAFMTYGFENAMLSTQQYPGTVTGIIFAGQIYTDAACTKPVSVLYKYKDVFYRELRALLDANKDDDALKGLNENSSDDDAAAVTGLDVYRNGRCFYYTAEIKHMDDGNANSKGVMEFAIMRNNIYSLAVENFSAIGSATINPLPGGEVQDEGAYISVKATILPWIVRFNNIEF